MWHTASYTHVQISGDVAHKEGGLSRGATLGYAGLFFSHERVDTKGGTCQHLNLEPLVQVAGLALPHMFIHFLQFVINMLQKGFMSPVTRRSYHKDQNTLAHYCIAFSPLY